MMDIRYIYVDLFCGAGGTATGVEKARVEGRKCAKVIAGVNHDPKAIASNAANNPDTLYFTEDIRTLDLTELVAHVARMRQKYPQAFLVLWASLECTNHSRAKGGMSRDADSRTLAEHLFRYIEAIRPDYVKIENVIEFTMWGPLMVKEVTDKKTGCTYCPLEIKRDKKRRVVSIGPVWVPDPEQKGIYYNRWVQQVKEYGYNFESRVLNSADFGARTSRRRYFGQFVRPGIPITWPAPTHAKNPKPGNLFDGQLQKWLPVRPCLDLEDQGASIFDRKKPLVEASLARHYAGCIQFVAGGKDAFIVKYNSMNQRGNYVAPGIDEPCPTVATQNRLGIAQVVPAGDGRFICKHFGGSPEGKCSPLTAPAGTVTCIDHHALVSAQFLSAYYGNGFVSSVDRPAPTVTTKDRFQLVQPFLATYYTPGYSVPVDSPAPTVRTKDCLVLVQPFLANSYSGGGQVSAIDAPAPAIMTKPKQNLVTPWIMNTSFNNVGSSLDAPAPTVTANRKWHYLMNPQYASAGGSTEMPCFTLIARMDKRPPQLVTVETDKRVLPSFIRSEGGVLIYEIYPDDSPMTVNIKEFMALYGIVDIKSRMLRIPELKRIMGFPSDYILYGTQGDQKKFIGNAVEVTQAQVQCEADARRIIELNITPQSMAA